MPLKFEINTKPESYNDIISIIKRININEKNIDLSKIKINFENNIMTMTFTGDFTNDSFQKLIVLIEKISFLYSIHLYDPKKEKNFASFSSNGDIHFVLNEDDYERLTTNEKLRSELRIVNKKDIYISYKKNQELIDIPDSDACRSVLNRMSHIKENEYISYSDFIINIK